MRSALLRWFRTHQRDLPWRRTRDPFAIWISEAMLQQTRVDTVLRYWEPFLTRFPDVHALANASIEEVFSAWAGLGYYSRARNLQRAAREVISRFDGRVPRDVEELRSLPGVGRYTAGAIASIAFDEPAPIVDANVERVLARWIGLREDVRGRATASRLWEVAEELAQGRTPGQANQALMELGALVCTPRTPLCNGCPIASGCDAREHGDAEALPVRAPKKSPLAVHAAAAWLERGGRVLLVRRQASGLLGGLWELPGVELTRRGDDEATLREALRARTGLVIDQLESAGHVEHVFTHRRLRLVLYRATAPTTRVTLDGYVSHCWCARDEINAIAESRLLRKAVARVVKVEERVADAVVANHTRASRKHAVLARSVRAGTARATTGRTATDRVL
jgi:A/G-specific adenine glycosylase